MENKKEMNGTEILGNIGLFFLSIGSVFYRILLLTLIWGWFIADKLFDVSYWGMFLVVLVIGFFKGGYLIHLENELKFDKVLEKKGLTLTDKFTVKLKSLLFHTVTFGIIWLVYVIIT